MLPASLLLLVALAGSSYAAPSRQVVTSNSRLLPLLQDDFQGGHRIALRSQTLDRVATGKGSSAGFARRGVGFERRAQAQEEEEGAVWEPLGWEQAGGSYSVPIEVGNPPATYYVQLDTASSDLVLASTLCLSSSACRALLSSRLDSTVLQEAANPSTPYVELYNPDSSLSFTSVNGNASVWASSFADGTAAGGFVAQERVAWGGVVGPQAGRLVLEDQGFGLINSTNLTLSSQHVSGIFGLGLPRLSGISSLFDGQQGLPLLSRLAHSSTLEYPVFGLHLDKNTTLGGSLTLGAVDGEIVWDQSLIQWHPLVKFPPFKNATLQNETSSFLQWTVELTNVTMNGTDPVKLFSAAYPETRNETYALIDSGASGIFGPLEDVEYLFSLVDGSRMVSDGVWIAPCNTRQTMTFSFGGRDYVLQPSEWLMGRVSTNTYECLAWPVALAPSGDGIGWQLGTPFLRSVYSVFNMGIEGVQEPLIGFYPLHASSTLNETSANTSSILDESPYMTTTLPNNLLPTPTFYTPPYIFNTSAWTTTTASQTFTNLPTRTEGLGGSSYAALPLAQGASVTTLAPGSSALPTTGPVNSSVVQDLQSARESIASVASVTWGAGYSSSAQPLVPASSTSSFGFALILAALGLVF